MCFFEYVAVQVYKPVKFGDNKFTSWIVISLSPIVPASGDLNVKKSFKLTTILTCMNIIKIIIALGEQLSLMGSLVRKLYYKLSLEYGNETYEPNMNRKTVFFKVKIDQ